MSGLTLPPRRNIEAILRGLPREPSQEVLGNVYLEEASELYEEIKSQIGKENNLYNPGVGYEGKFTSVNAVVGLLGFVLGFEGEASELYGEINSQIGKEDKLYNHGVGDKSKFTFDNAAMGLLLCLLGGKRLK